MIERFQSTGEPVFWFLCALRHGSDFSVFPCDKENDAIGIRQRILTQHNGFGFMDRHIVEI
jgi:hypothetical protein